MSYYSNVYILAEKRIAKKILVYLSVHGNCFDEIRISPTGKTVMFHADDISWHREDSTQIDMIMDILERSSKSKYKFIRFGEQEDDVEQLGQGKVSEGSLTEDGIDPSINDWEEINPYEMNASKRDILISHWDEFLLKARGLGYSKADIASLIK